MTPENDMWLLFNLRSYCSLNLVACCIQHNRCSPSTSYMIKPTNSEPFISMSQTLHTVPITKTFSAANYFITKQSIHLPKAKLFYVYTSRHHFARKTSWQIGATLINVAFLQTLPKTNSLSKGITATKSIHLQIYIY